MGFLSVCFGTLRLPFAMRVCKQTKCVRVRCLRDHSLRLSQKRVTLLRVYRFPQIYFSESAFFTERERERERERGAKWWFALFSNAHKSNQTELLICKISYKSLPLRIWKGKGNNLLFVQWISLAFTCVQYTQFKEARVLGWRASVHAFTFVCLQPVELLELDRVMPCDILLWISS